MLGIYAKLRKETQVGSSIEDLHPANRANAEQFHSYPRTRRRVAQLCQAIC